MGFVLSFEPMEPANFAPVRSTAYRLGMIGAYFLVGCVVILLGTFGYSVAHYVKGIRSGDISVAPRSFAASQAPDTKTLLRLAAASPGTGNLAPANEPSLGKATAPVTVVEFADFGCPYSAEVSEVIRALAVQYPEQIRFVYRDFPLDELHPGATLASRGGYCAAQSGQFWQFHDAIYRKQSDLSREAIIALASDLGLGDRFVTCLDDDASAKAVSADIADGIKAGVSATPTFFINGTRVEGSIPYAYFVELINAFLRAPR